MMPMLSRFKSVIRSVLASNRLGRSILHKNPSKQDMLRVEGGVYRLGNQLANVDARLADLACRLIPHLQNDLMWMRGFMAAQMPTRPDNDLRNFEKRVYSQNGEDGILEEIFRRIGVTNQYFVEFGVESGVECNSARLALNLGWHGLFMEGDQTFFDALRTRYAPIERIRCSHTMITSANIESLLEQHEVPKELDLLSIDVDGNDYWIWKAISRWRPRVVAIEYNGAHPPGTLWVMKENPDHRWGGTTYYGASLTSLTRLGREKGYTLVGTNSTGVNAFFVRDDLATYDRFLDPAVCYHFSIASHGLTYPGGHPKGSGPFVEI